LKKLAPAGKLKGNAWIAESSLYNFWGEIKMKPQLINYLIFIPVTVYSPNAYSNKTTPN
jgi:hypothetical protein